MAKVQGLSKVYETLRLLFFRQATNQDFQSIQNNVAVVATTTIMVLDSMCKDIYGGRSNKSLNRKP